MQVVQQQGTLKLCITVPWEAAHCPILGIKDRHHLSDYKVRSFFRKNIFVNIKLSCQGELGVNDSI